MVLNLVQLYNLCAKDDIIEYLQNWGLIPKEGEYKCPKCDGILRIIATKNNCIDGYVWVCRGKVSIRKQKATFCNHRISIRTKTFFAKSHLNFWQILGFVNLWVDNVPFFVIGKQCDISKNTLTDWASFCREVTYDAMIIKREKLGGPGKTVEIDKSKFGKRKYYRGHHVEGQWVFGGIEHESGKVFMVLVEDRKSQTLIPIIKQWIKAGTTIISDFWKSYDCLADEGYHHLKVNQSINFKDPETGALTNAIESSWRCAKATIGPGTHRKHMFPSHLAKFMFMKMCRYQRIDPCEAFYRLAGDLYSPLKPDVNISDEERCVEEEECDESFA